jgi:rhodanese-related sulfurtransferase
VPRVSVDELAELMSGPNPPVILDVRARASYDHNGSQIPGSIRVLPD